MSENNKKDKGSFINISDLTGFSKPIEKLIDCISKGLGNSFNPRFTRKMADANVYEIEKLKNILNDSQSEVTISRNGTTITLKNESEKLALDYMLDKELKKLENISKIIQNTADILKDKVCVSEDSVDEDWITRFFRVAEDVTNEDMQNLWSKILADEIEKPNSYSLRTLEVVKNLSSKEAKLFTKFVNLCFKVQNEEKLRSINDIEFLIKFGITQEDMNLLEEINLVSSSLSYMIKPSKAIHFIHCDKLLAVENKGSSEILIWVYTIIEKNFELSYAKNFGEYFKGKGEISTYMVDINLDDFSYEEENMIEI